MLPPRLQALLAQRERRKAEEKRSLEPFLAGKPEQPALGSVESHWAVLQAEARLGEGAPWGRISCPICLKDLLSVTIPAHTASNYLLITELENDFMADGGVAVTKKKFPSRGSGWSREGR